MDARPLFPRPRTAVGSESESEASVRSMSGNNDRREWDWEDDVDSFFKADLVGDVSIKNCSRSNSSLIGTVQVAGCGHLTPLADIISAAVDGVVCLGKAVLMRSLAPHTLVILWTKPSAKSRSLDSTTWRKVGFPPRRSAGK